jgi:hypothetical protein
MGQIAKPVGSSTTRYYWYPGDRVEWIRAGLAVLTGVLAAALGGLLTRSLLGALTIGGSVTAVFAGVNFGRRDLRAIRDFPVEALSAADAGPDPVRGARPEARSSRALRRAAVRHGSRAGWRAMVQGVGGAILALLIANLSEHGVLADWVMPVIPVLLGALAHQVGMVYERLAQVQPPSLPPVPVRSAGQRPTGTDPAPRAAQPVYAHGRAAGPTLRLTSYRGHAPGHPDTD